jgi:hypothetical protein
MLDDNEPGCTSVTVFRLQTAVTGENEVANVTADFLLHISHTPTYGIHHRRSSKTVFADSDRGTRGKPNDRGDDIGSHCDGPKALPIETDVRLSFGNEYARDGR